MKMNTKENNLTKDNLIDSKDIYICIYDEYNIGLFKRISWSTRPHKNIVGGYKYNAGNIYIGIDTDHIGMNKIHEEYFNIDKCEPIGTCVRYKRKKYISDCKIEKAINLDNMRLDMYLNGEIQEYIPGKANSKELIEALSCACEYYKLNSEEVKKKKKY